MSNSSVSKNIKTSGQSQTADDILASLMVDLKDIDVPIDEQEKTGNNLDDYSTASESVTQDLLDIPGFTNQISESLPLRAVQSVEEAEEEDLKSKSWFLSETGLNENYLESNDSAMEIEEADDGVGESTQFRNNDLKLSESVKDNDDVNSLSSQSFSLSDQDEYSANDEENMVGELRGLNHVIPSTAQDQDVQNHLELNENERTVALQHVSSPVAAYSDQERTLAVTGYSNRAQTSHEENVKVSVGQVRSSYSSWGSADGNLALADHLKIAQDKIIQLQEENEKLRFQNDEISSASDIIRERAEILNQQIHELQTDRQNFENTFKEENQIYKNQLIRKESEIGKLNQKIEELESRLNFDMKKIRIRERELENRLELLRAEKNALVKSKDEQILEFRRKLDQMEIVKDSYRQKCVDLNKSLEVNQESFKKATRVLRLAMANLELQDEVKVPLKKAE